MDRYDIRCNYVVDGPYEQINSLTSFVDASQVYGNSEAEANSLRDLSTPEEFGRGTP